MGERRAYPRDQSKLYNIISPAQLRDLLNIKERKLIRILDRRDNYICWVDEKSKRDIQKPKPFLDIIHKRIATLLSRIETPDFLHSAIKGKSYVTNAAQHSPNFPSIKIDIRKYYPSVRAQAIFHFFCNRMKCAQDVAGILTKLLTVDGHLATGSSVSPILSYYAYEDMFQEMAALAGERGCVMTCYVDDMVFTGKGATRQLIYDMRKIARRYRLWVHKTKIFSASQPKVVTGVAVTKLGLRLPNKRQKIIREEHALLPDLSQPNERLAAVRRLASRVHEAGQVDPAWKPKATALSAHARMLVTEKQN